MRKIKEGKRGVSTKYVSRSKAIRKLQVSLKDFRKMCILKGVYPREPPKKLKKHNRTFYHLKDINFLALDPLLNRFRAQKIHLRKYRTAKSRGDIGKVKYLSAHKPKVSLNHLVRQRYPDFLDALRDLDDPLTLLSLFSIFPSHKEFGLSAQKIQICANLMKHVELYAIHTHCLRKAFVSIKGIYYQLEILGIKVTFITPYKYPPSLPIEVDYRVMCTFLDFYIVLIKFVLFKLYSLQNLQYPPTLIANNSEDLSYSDYSLVQVEKTDNVDAESKYQIDKQFANIKADSQQKLLFKNLRFYLSNQVPKYSLQFIILACGGQICRESTDQTITHYITDRDDIKQLKTKEYIQPQWIYDSLNFNILLPVKDYWLGKELPPHVSPFVDQTDTDRHIPQREKELRDILIGKKNEPSVPEQNNNDEFDVVNEKKMDKKKKKMQEKEFADISKKMVSNKNRKILKTIEIQKSKKAQVTNKLLEKSKKIKN